MKVALISHSFPPNITGGIGSYTFSLAEALTKKGIDVTVFCGGKVDKEGDCNFKIKRLPMFNFPPRAVWFQLQNLKFFFNELKNFDIVHGQMTATTFYSFIKKKINRPWVVTFHDHPTRGLNCILNSLNETKNFGDFIFNILEYPLYKKLCDLDIKNANKIISVGVPLVGDLIKYSRLDPKKVAIINNGINLGNIKKICIPIDKRDPNQIRLIFFGRLFYGKGITFLIAAMKQVIQKEKNIRLDVYGEGPLEKNIRREIQSNNLYKYIHLHKFIPNEEVIRQLKNSDILVFPSLFESFGLVLLESMSTGVPIITSNIPDLRSTIKDNYNGILVKPTPEKIAQAIERLIKNPGLREKLAKNGLKEVKKYSWDKIADQYIQLYKQVLEEHNHETLNKTKK